MRVERETREARLKQAGNHSRIKRARGSKAMDEEKCYTRLFAGALGRAPGVVQLLLANPSKGHRIGMMMLIRYEALSPRCSNCLQRHRCHTKGHTKRH